MGKLVTKEETEAAIRNGEQKGCTYELAEAAVKFGLIKELTAEFGLTAEEVKALLSE